MTESVLRYLRQSNNRLAHTTTTLTANVATGSLVSAFPVGNVGALPVSKPMVVDGAGGSVDFRILANLGSAHANTLIGIVGNFTHAAAVTMRRGTTGNPGGTTTALTIRNGVAWATFASISRRYWSIQVEDDVDQGVYGIAVLGVKADTPAGLARTWDTGVTKNIRTVNNELGVPMIGRKVTEFRSPSFSWEGITETERDGLDSFLDGLDGPINPIFLITPDDRTALFGRLASAGYSISQINDYYNVGGVQFRADPVGTIVT